MCSQCSSWLPPELVVERGRDRGCSAFQVMTLERSEGVALKKRRSEEQMAEK